MSKRPTLRRPTQEQIEEAIEELEHVEIGQYCVRKMKVSNMNPTEEIEEDWVPEEMMAAMDADPSSLPPIVVSGDDIVDGHHRWMAAQQLGIKELWVLDGECWPR